MTSSIPFDLYMRLSGHTTQSGLAGSNEPDPPRDEGDEGTRRLAWQRALEHAQDGNFEGWFGAAQTSAETMRFSAQPIARSAPLQPLFTPASTSAARGQALSPGSTQNTSSSTTVTADEPVRAGTATELSTDPHESVSPDAASGAVVASWGALLASEMAQAWALPVLLVSSAVDVLAASPTTAEAFHLPAQMPSGPATWFGTPNPTLDAAASGEEVTAQDGASSERLAKLPSRPDESDAVRLYAEWSGQGVRIWLGGNADGQISISDLAPQLQRLLAAQGTRLLALVCNGQAVWKEGDPVPAAVGSDDATSPAGARDAFRLPARLRGSHPPYSKETP